MKHSITYLDNSTIICWEDGRIVIVEENLEVCTMESSRSWVTFSAFSGRSISACADGTVERRQHNKLHCDDGPALVWPNGRKDWYHRGLHHRVGGPAIIYANGGMLWYQNGKLHRDDGPAVVYTDGSKYWYQNGKNFQSKRKTEKNTCHTKTGA